MAFFLHVLASPRSKSIEGQPLGFCWKANFIQVMKTYTTLQMLIFPFLNTLLLRISGMSPRSSQGKKSKKTRKRKFKMIRAEKKRPVLMFPIRS